MPKIFGLPFKFLFVALSQLPIKEKIQYQMTNKAVVIGVGNIKQHGSFKDLDEALILMDKATKKAIKIHQRILQTSLMK